MYLHIMYLDRLLIKLADRPVIKKKTVFHVTGILIARSYSLCGTSTILENSSSGNPAQYSTVFSFEESFSLRHS